MLEAMKKLKTPLGILKFPALISTISNYIETNIPEGAMLKYAYIAKGIKPDMVQKEILPGEAKYIGATSYYVWNNDLNDKFIEKFRGIETEDTPVANNVNTPQTNSSENTAQKDTSGSSNTSINNNTSVDNSVPVENTNENNNNVNTSSTIQKKNVEVIILNSTGKQGLAATYKGELEKLGYKIIQTGNYAYKKYSNTIINDYSKKGFGATLKADMAFGKVMKKQKSKQSADLVVILGTDSIK
jgi:hypothetical protein